LPPSTNKTDRHDITEILLKVALNTIALTLTTYLRKPPTNILVLSKTDKMWSTASLPETQKVFNLKIVK
jgi:hypothetical protein